MKTTILASVRALVVFTFVTGVAYPLLVTVVAQLCFPAAAGGSLVERDGRVVGSRLVAQAFTSPRYFHPRPSAVGYDASASGASNLAPTNPALARAIAERTARVAAEDPAVGGAPPPDLVTTSGSGLDPHVTPEGALYQARRVARARGLDEARVRALVAAHTEPPLLGLFGAARVNVLELNLALDELAP